jgi:hypothetical protein
MSDVKPGWGRLIFAAPAEIIQATEAAASQPARSDFR